MFCLLFLQGLALRVLQQAHLLRLPERQVMLFQKCNRNGNSQLKKLDAPIIPAGAATSCGNFKTLLAKYAMKKMRKVCIISGIAISKICKGFSRITLPWNENNSIKVNSNPMVVMPSNFFTKVPSKYSLLLLWSQSHGLLFLLQVELLQKAQRIKSRCSKEP